MASHFIHDNSIAQGVVQAHTVYGSPVSATARPNSHGENIAPATWSTAPYVPPKRREGDKGKPLCSHEGCKAWPLKDVPYCTGHARKMGLMPSCATVGCNAAPMGSTGLCYHHQPKQVTEEVPADGNAE